jgi:sulfhydrogenase subunit alpha
VVHTITSINAIENAFGVKVSDQTLLLREMLNIGGIIQSHVLHLYFLTLPDYAGAENALALAKKNKAIIDRALRLKRIGNLIVTTIAGRDIHPISCVIGGFSRVPEQDKLHLLLQELKDAKQDALETVRFFSGLDYPAVKNDSPYFALKGGSYFYSDKLVNCKGGACFEVKDYKQHFKEYLRQGSTAEFATQEGKSYFVGALARVSNNRDLLSPESAELAGIIFADDKNPFMNIPAQAVEVLEGINRCIEILSSLEVAQEAPVEAKIRPCACEGIAACEAPRGVLFHHYKFDDNGHCTYADITTPTTQNLQHLEEAIKGYLPSILGRSPDEIKLEMEKLIRAYDPCISCSTHFLEIEFEMD